MTFTEFLRRFPDNDACLEHLKQKFYPDGTECPKCHKPSKFHRITGRSAYSCQYCAHHVYPTAHTIFHKSTTSLQLWFWAIYLISSSKCGISAKQLGREVGVTYKTAWRMMKQIRLLLADDEPLSGDVEVDETFIGGKPRMADVRRHAQAEHPQQAARQWSQEHKKIVLAAVERGGRVRAEVIPDRTKPTLHGKIREFVLPSSMIFTDEWKLYVGIGREYKGHLRVNHSQRIYVSSDGASTNTAESFFGLFKNSVRGAHHNVSAKYLQHYLNEYTFRWNRRKATGSLFWAILDRAEKDHLAAA
jgi:transposase